MKTVTTVMDVRDLVSSDVKEISERLRYLHETKQNIEVKITQKAGEPLVVEINDPLPEGYVAPVEEPVKKGKSK